MYNVQCTYVHLNFREVVNAHPYVLDDFGKKLENFGGHLLSEDDHSYWAPPSWNITKETLNIIANCQLRVLGMFITK